MADAFGQEIHKLYHKQGTPQEMRTLRDRLASDPAFCARFQAYERMQAAIAGVTPSGTEPPDTCPQATQIDAFLDGQLSPTQRHAFITHLSTCKPCRAQISDALYLLRMDEPAQGAPLAEAVSRFYAVVCRVMGRALTFLTAPKQPLAMALPAMRTADKDGGSVLRRTYELPDGQFVFISRLLDAQGSPKRIEIQCSNTKTKLWAFNEAGLPCFVAEGNKAYEYLEPCVLIIDDSFCIEIE